MAPMKAMKRARSTARPITTRCAQIAEGLQRHPCGKMLATTLVDTVGVRKAKRHANQDAVATMVKQALEGIGQQAEKEVADLQARIAASEAERASRTSVLEAAKATLQEKLDAIAKATSDIKEANDADKAARAAVEKAEEAKETCVDICIERSGKKERLDTLESVWASLRDGTAVVSTPEFKAAMSSLHAAEKVMEMEKTMIDSLPGALKKAPSDRGSFDMYLVKTAEEELKNLQPLLAAAIAAGEQEQATLTANVTTTKEAGVQAAERVANCNTAKGLAIAAKSTAQGAQAAADAAVDAYDQEMKIVHHAHKKATASLEKFLRGAVKAFKQLENVTDESPGFVFENIDGVGCDTAIVSVCRNAAEKGGGTISAEAAAAFLKKINESGELSSTGRWSIRYCLTEFAWAEAAHDMVVEINKSLPREPEKKKAKASKSKYYVTVDGVKCDSRIIEKCIVAVAGEGDGRVSVEDAKSVFGAVGDGGRMTPCEKWTLRYCLMEYKWTAAAQNWIFGALVKLHQGN